MTSTTASILKYFPLHVCHVLGVTIQYLSSLVSSTTVVGIVQDCYDMIITGLFAKYSSNLLSNFFGLNFTLNILLYISYNAHIQQICRIDMFFTRFIYYMSKKSCPSLYSNLMYKYGHKTSWIHSRIVYRVFIKCCPHSTTVP